MDSGLPGFLYDLNTLIFREREMMMIMMMKKRKGRKKRRQKKTEERESQFLLNGIRIEELK